MSKTEKYRANNTIKMDRKWHSPGTELELSPEEAKPLLDSGAISRRGEAAPKPGADQPPPIDDMTKDELEAQAEKLGIDIGEIEGTGSKGAVVKDDLIKAIQKHAASQ